MHGDLGNTVILEYRVWRKRVFLDVVGAHQGIKSELQTRFISGLSNFHLILSGVNAISG